MIELFKFTIISTVGIVGSFIVLGFLLGIIEQQTERNLYFKFGNKAIIITGILGTTIHEIGHYIMCKLFFHKVTDIKLFSLRIEGNELGHVSHSYNKKNIYQRIGNFFIGIGPLIFGTFVMILFFKILLPESFHNTISNFNLESYMNLSKNFNLVNFLIDLLKDAMLLLLSIFKLSNIISLKFWIFLFIAISISTHMSLSRADLKNSFDGIVFIFIINFIVSFIVTVFNINIATLTSVILLYNILIFVFLLFAIIFSIIGFIISFIIKVI